MMGVTSDLDLQVDAVGKGTRIVKRRGTADGVEGYTWGGLTSSSLNTTSWLVFLPFTLLNAAGFSRPRRFVRAHEWVSRLVGLAATACYVLWTADILIGIVAGQWRARLMALTAVNRQPALDGAVEYVLALVAGLATLGAVALLFLLMNTRSPTNRDESTGWQPDETFGPDFYQHGRSRWKLLCWHVGVAVGCLIAVAVAWFVRRDDLYLGDLVVFAGGAMGCLLILLWILALASKSRPHGAAMATVGAVAANAAFAGTALLASDVLSGWPDLPKGCPAVAGGCPAIGGGPELALATAFLVALVGGVLAAAISVAHLWFRHGPGDDPSEQPPPPVPLTEPITSPLDQLDAANAQALAGTAFAARLARLAHGAMNPVCWLAAAFILGGLGYVALLAGQGRVPWDPTLGRELGGWPVTAGAFVLAALPVIIAGALHRSARNVSGRRTLGVIWDVLLIWPRRFHPLAVPPYAVVVTEELTQRLRHLAGRSDPLVLSAHSQGSALSYIALWQLGDDVARSVNLVTYGSHINAIYAVAFPHHFNHGRIGDLRHRLATWCNFWRITDPIGGPMFTDSPYTGLHQPNEESEHDVRCPDPGDRRPDGQVDQAPDHAPLERDRQPNTGLAVHSWYLAEWRLKNWVDDRRGQSSG